MQKCNHRCKNGKSRGGAKIDVPPCGGKNNLHPNLPIRELESLDFEYLLATVGSSAEGGTTEPCVGGNADNSYTEREQQFATKGRC